MSIILVDTETTGLVKPAGTDLNLQPYIIELCALRQSDSGEDEGLLSTLIKPPIPLPKHITKITKIEDKDLVHAPEFIEVYKKLVELALGCHTFIAHNAAFDSALIDFELQRMGKQLQFPWPPIHFCTVEQTMHIRGHRLKLGELYEIATGNTEIAGAHRAENDVRAMAECYHWLRGTDVD